MYSNYKSPIGEIIIKVEDNIIKELKFNDEDKVYDFKDNDLTKKLKKDLDDYFKFKKINFNYKIDFKKTKFQKDVLDIVSKIKYGEVITYKEIGDILLKEFNYKNISYQAIGKAVGKNKVLILIPCHRVIGSDNTLKGYSAGIKRKEYLLNLEKGER